MNNCGVCNHNVPLNHAQVMRLESDGTATSYHMGCESAARKIKPCDDCGHHYDEQVPLRVIAENVNRDYHGGNPVRNENSIRYVVNKMLHDDEWRSRLEEKWINSAEGTHGTSK